MFEEKNKKRAERDYLDYQIIKTYFYLRPLHTIQEIADALEIHKNTLDSRIKELKSMDRKEYFILIKQLVNDNEVKIKEVKT